jgi:hypothetical protein
VSDDRHGERARWRHLRITERDRLVLSFIAEHAFVLTAHAQALLGISEGAASRRLAALRSAGLLDREEAFYRWPCHRITREGLRVIGSELPLPRFGPSNYWHDVGLAWLTVGARAGAFGPLAEIVSERRMRASDGAAQAAGSGYGAAQAAGSGYGAAQAAGSSDGAAQAAGSSAEPFGVRLGGLGPGGRPRLHYPDLVLRSSGGHRIAVELELSGKSRADRERILLGYSLDGRFDAVVYFVNDPVVARAVGASVARLGLGSLVRVQRFEWDPRIRPPGRGEPARTAARPAARPAARRAGAPLTPGRAAVRPTPGRAAGETSL